MVKNEPFLLKRWCAKVRKKGNAKARCFKVVKNLSLFDHGQLANSFQFEDYGSKTDEIGTVRGREFVAFIEHREFTLGTKRNIAKTEFLRESLLVHRLEKTRTKRSMNLQRCADNRVRPGIPFRADSRFNPGP